MDNKILFNTLTGGAGLIAKTDQSVVIILDCLTVRVGIQDIELEDEYKAISSKSGSFRLTLNSEYDKVKQFIIE